MIRFTLNGTQIEAQDGENRTLLEYLRNVKCMKGTKEACSTGHCGACSVLVDGRLTRSCVTLVRRLDGKAVETIENAPNDTMLQVHHRGICRGRRCAVRLLHTGHGDGDKGAAAALSGSD